MFLRLLNSIAISFHPSLPNGDPPMIDDDKHTLSLLLF